MRFTVVWTRAALNQLANIWMAAPDRQAVADATNQIDATLAVDPH